MPLSDLDREQLHDGTPDKRPLIRGDGAPFVDVIVDRWGRDELCSICLSSFMPVPNSAGIGHGPGRPRCWWVTQSIDEAVRAQALAYLENPACTPDMHAWYEREQIEDAKNRIALVEEELEAAESALAQLQARPAGWSIKSEVRA